MLAPVLELASQDNVILPKAIVLVSSLLIYRVQATLHMRLNGWLSIAAALLFGISLAVAVLCRYRVIEEKRGVYYEVIVHRAYPKSQYDEA
jgi:hypothetical protein